MNDIQLARHYPKNFYQLRKRITEISGQEIFDPARPKIPVIFRPGPTAMKDFGSRLKIPWPEIPFSRERHIFTNNFFYYFILFI